MRRGNGAARSCFLCCFSVASLLLAGATTSFPCLFLSCVPLPSWLALSHNALLCGHEDTLCSPHGREHTPSRFQCFSEGCETKQRAKRCRRRKKERERERGRHATVRERVRVFMFGAVCERWEGLDSGVAKQTSTQLIMSCQKR